MMLPANGLPLPMHRWVCELLANCRLKVSTHALSSPSCTPLIFSPVTSLKPYRRWLASGAGLTMNDVLSALSCHEVAINVVVTLISLSFGTSMLIVST
ncbi:hypothetical protein D3C77_304960 [compost metagenome]